MVVAAYGAAMQRGAVEGWMTGFNLHVVGGVARRGGEVEGMSICKFYEEFGHLFWDKVI